MKDVMESGSISNSELPIILVVDDDPGNLGVMSALLKDSGFRVIVARDGKSALEKAHYGKPDLILLDLLMPKMDGFQVCARLKSDEPLKDIPVIFMTALMDMADKVKGFQSGGVDYITKPFQPEEVLARVRTHLSLHEMQKQLEARNTVLQREVEARKRAESELKKSYDEMEQRVKDRTAEISQANERLKESEERYRLIAENTADTIAVFDLNFNPTYFSPAILKHRGYTVQEAMTQTLDQMLTPDSLQQASKIFAEQMALESSGTADPARTALIELEEYCKDGSTVWVEIAASFLRDNNFKPAGILTVTRDITERKQAEKRLKETLDRLRKSIDTTIQVLVSALESRDPYTAGHQSRVTHLARTIAKEMGLSQDKIDGIRMAGSIHDIGKLSIPAEILSKPTKLTNNEFNLIKEHPQIGYEILKDVESPWPLAEIVYQHHERMNGSGYPRNLKGDEILMEARILAVADVVEAMASHRPYRPGMGIEAALEEIEKNKGVLYDKAVADVCLRLFREKGYQLT